MSRIVSLMLLLGFAAVCEAGKYNKILSIGDDAPAWVNLEGVDGKKHSLSDLKESPIVIVVFTCNSCPIAQDYEDRIIALQKSYSKIPIVAINVNTIKDDLLPAMKERAKKKQFPFAYLYDATQKIGKAYGANYTPEFFVLNADRKIVYMGALDDKIPPAMPMTLYIEEAIAAIRNGEAPTVAETFPLGCRIRYKRR